MKQIKKHSRIPFCIIPVLIMFVISSGCATSLPEAKTELYHGVSSTQLTYDGSAAGKHWIRPQEFTYIPLDIVEYETVVELSEYTIQEVAIFGYPEPGQEANPYITLAVSEAVAELQADAFLLNTYSIDRDYEYNENLDLTSDSVHVTIQGRPMELVSLGEVDQTRADQERFITTTVVEEHIEEGIIKTTTTTSPATANASFLDISDFGNSTSQAVSAAESSSEPGGVNGWVVAGGVLGGITLISLIGYLASY